MPRYYFNLHNDVVTIDEEGTECRDLSAASKKAVEEARILAAESIKQHGHLILDHRVEIVDASRNVIKTVRFSDVIEIRAT